MPLRQKQNITQNQMADTLEVSRQTIIVDLSQYFETLSLILLRLRL
ncbi:TPA: HTH domain-containing protein [Bacillus cereus]|nr:HTH domain-containing protein [Bacillus cereus]